MEDRETPRMRKYGESKTTRIMMATVPQLTSGSGLRKFQADGFLFDRVYNMWGPLISTKNGGLKINYFTETNNCFVVYPILRKRSAHKLHFRKRLLLRRQASRHIGVEENKIAIKQELKDRASWLNQ